MSTNSTTEPKPACGPSATPPDAASCPTPEAILALCSRLPPPPGALPLLLHLARCPSCRAALAFAAAAAAHVDAFAAAQPPPAESPAEETSILRAILASLSPLAAAVFTGLSNTAALAAGHSQGPFSSHGKPPLSDLGAVLSANALSKLALHFRSNLPNTAHGYWTSSLRVSPDDASRLEISVTLPNRPDPPPDGIFTLCGLSTPVAAGHASLSLADFVRNLPTGGVSFAPPGAPPVPGSLSLSP